MRNTGLRKRLVAGAFHLVLAVTLSPVAHAGDEAAGADHDPLPSWNEGTAKQNILRFVKRTTDRSDPSYVLPQDRIATFDNDGTLWCEKPTWVQLLFALQQFREIAEADPELRDQQPYQAALRQNHEYFENLPTSQVVYLVLTVDSGLSQRRFTEAAQRFLDTTKHPRFHVPYRELVYEPMLGLLAFLKSNEFKVYIVTGGGTGFVRAYSESTYHVPRQNVVGSTVQYTFELSEVGPVFVRQDALVAPIAHGKGKPIGIQRHVGRRPIFAAGNSDGDIEMLEFATDKQQPSLALLIRHDDAAREYSYTRRAEEALKLAAEGNWTLVSMKNDFKSVFSFQDGES